MAGQEKFLRARQVARMLGVSTKWVYEAAREGRIPSYRFGGAVRFRKSEIEAWIAQRAHQLEEP